MDDPKTPLDTDADADAAPAANPVKVGTPYAPLILVGCSHEQSPWSICGLPPRFRCVSCRGYFCADHTGLVEERRPLAADTDAYVTVWYHTCPACNALGPIREAVLQPSPAPPTGPVGPVAGKVAAFDPAT